MSEIDNTEEWSKGNPKPVASNNLASAEIVGEKVIRFANKQRID